MKTKNKFLTLLLVTSFFSLSLYSETGIERIMNQTNSGIKTTTTGDKIEDKQKEVDVYNYEEVVYQRILDSQKNDERISPSKQSKNFAFSNKKKREKELQLLAKNAQQEIERIKQQSDQKTFSKNNVKFASGYCYVDNEITVERLSTYAYLSCDFQEPVGHATLAISVSPDFYAKALIGTPLYIEKNSQRIPITSGAILTKNKNSINIANLVNDRKIAKITATGIYTATTVMTKEAQAYLAMKQQAATSTDMNTIATTGGTTTVSATNTKEISLDNYLIAGGIELLSSLSKVIGEAVINDLPYTFKIYKNSILFVDVELASKDKVIGFKTVRKNNNMSAKEPKFFLNGTSEESKQSIIQQRTDKK